ncbi:related to beta (1-3) glucanosyltransferase [Cephalotrichum gorgonifer]|uniref:1,3-beta-glucanosyltransferase n=1 Tax=Cephalotrichum gorgonifer TaxID=2041049 RepID=A0AAE8N270_9PEZI|nr:related to beta (1-3) glucanosyltransferase [Cephalotrichum gorgonifer]
MRSTWALLAGLTAVYGLPTIETYGNKFYDSNGKQFFIKGMSYQLRPNDPLIDSEQCARDVKLMEELGVNTIRVYHVDPKANHDGCMDVFDKAGIYVTLDMDTFPTFIKPYNSYWNTTQFEMYSAVMDTFIKYDNLMALYVGNEIIAKSDQSLSAPFIKAAVRDMKAYRDRKGYRKVPVGYTAADIAELRPMLQDYLTCGGNSSETVDFFGLNAYEWCTPNTYEASGYPVLQEMAEQFPVPIFFSETGCITGPEPRKWEDMDAIFSQPMVDDWSGAMVYEWIFEQNQYGIVSYGEPAELGVETGDVHDGFTRKGTPTPRQPDFDNLKTRWASITLSGTPKSEYDPSAVSTRACPTSTKGGWEVDGNVRLPALDETYAGSFTPSPTATSEPTAEEDEEDGAPARGALGVSALLIVVSSMVAMVWM